MPRAVLFDLDETLLANPMDRFLPAYFEALTRYLEPVVPPSRLIQELRRATKVMNANRGDGLSNEEAFSRVFYPALDADRATLEGAFERFYAVEFPKLRVLTRRRPAARALVDWVSDRGIQVAVATNPLFPRTAVEQRLAWAGVPVDEVDYALVTTFENMHATKAHPSYYREILDVLGRQPSECLMVGDSWDYDVAPALSLGIRAYWVTEEDGPTRPEPLLVGTGSLRALWQSVSARGNLPSTVVVEESGNA